MDDEPGTPIPALLLPDAPLSGPGPLRFSLDAIPERERVAVYNEFFGRSVCRFEIEPLDDVPLFADVTVDNLPGLQLFTGGTHGFSWTRTPRLLADGTDDFALLVNFGGPHFASQFGKDLVLGNREATVLSEADPFVLERRSPGSLLVLRAPRKQLAPLLRRPGDRALPRIPHAASPLKLLVSYVRAARRELGIASSPDLQHAVVSHVHDLMALALGATRDAAEMAQGGGLRAARLSAIKQDIAANLGRPDLSVTALAQRHGCTPRFVQRLFEAEGTTLTEYVLAQRLRHAWRQLADPRRAGEKISTLAYDCGFGDVSYFNRAFRRHFGAAPSDVRAQARRAPAF